MAGHGSWTSTTPAAPRPRGSQSSPAPARSEVPYVGQTGPPLAGAQQGFGSGLFSAMLNAKDAVPTLNVKRAKLNVSWSDGRSWPAEAPVDRLVTRTSLRQYELVKTPLLNCNATCWRCSPVATARTSDGVAASVSLLTLRS